jgi:putative RNA 2'-phosphotransferase
MLSNAEISRAMSHALRHEPWLYELELDDEGWAPVDALIEALRRAGPEWKLILRADVERVLVQADKKRHELEGDRVRALYGHSVPGKLKKEAAPPPPLLFHGTSADVVSEIMASGLLPMGRQYVHLSAARDVAIEVGKRKGANLVVLVVDAARAHEAGVAFYTGNEKVWLADHVPPQFVSAGA